MFWFILLRSMHFLVFVLKKVAIWINLNNFLYICWLSILLLFLCVNGLISYCHVKLITISCICSSALPWVKITNLLNKPVKPDILPVSRLCPLFSLIFIYFDYARHRWINYYLPLFCTFLCLLVSFNSSSSSTCDLKHLS